MEIVLASKSPRRRELLSLLTNDFTVVVSNADESVSPELSPAERIMAISAKKAAAVKDVFSDKVIISADTAVFSGDRQFGKPRDTAEAVNMLSLLSGKTHSVITAYTVIYGDKSVTKSVETKVTFRRLSQKEIEKYISTGEPFDKAGGYGIQGAAAAFCERIDGDYTNVIGLPLCSLYETLCQMGIDL